MTGGDRDKALDAALANIERQFGKGSVMRLGDETRAALEVIPTGSVALDVALGIGGLPRGRVVEIYGPESSGKTTVALHAVANAQRGGGIVAFIDAEHALDPEYAKALGVDTDALLVSQPDSGEQALEIADMLIRSGALDLIVIDSVAALVPRAEIEGEMGDSHVGLQARLMSQALRKMTGALSGAGTTMIFINQLREKIGVMFGSPETTTGGRALKFYASVRLDVRRIETLKDGQEMVGNRTRIKVVKNKCLAEGTLVFDPVSGMSHAIEDVVDNKLPINVVAADKKGHLEVRPVVSWFDQGEQEVVGLRVKGGGELWTTPDHKVLTDQGWVVAGELSVGDKVARPREFLGFGEQQPISADQARLLGYLIGDGYVGGKTPAQFINTVPELRDDVTAVVGALGCDTKLHRDGLQLAISHRIGEKNGVIELCRWAGIWGHLAPTKKIPSELFAADVSADVVANLMFGLYESDGWVSREQTGALRIGYATTSEQLAHQIHWLLMRWGIASSVRRRDPHAQRGGLVKGRRIVGKLPSWEVRVAGMDNVQRFAAAIPMWGPRGRMLTEALGELTGRHRGSRHGYLPENATEPVLAYLRHLGVTPGFVVGVLEVPEHRAAGGLRQLLGAHRLRRDRLQRLAEALDDVFLFDILAEQVSYVAVTEVLPMRRARTFDVEVDELHNLVAEDVVVHNCAPPFKQAEFDIMYGQGISREGGLIDVGVDAGLVRKAGAWYTYEGDQLGQGKENARAFLRDNPDLANEIEKRILEKLGIGASVDTGPDTGADTGPGAGPDDTVPDPLGEPTGVDF
jgi:recombination protein RecA